MPAAIRSALAAGKALAARPGKAATRRRKDAHSFTFALQPVRLSAVAAGSYQLRFVRGVKVACTAAVELTAAAEGGESDWPADGGRMVLLVTLYREDGGGGDDNDAGGDGNDAGDSSSSRGRVCRSRVRREVHPPASPAPVAGGFDAKDAKLSLLRVCARTRTESTVGKAHFDLAVHARVPSGVTPLELHLTNGMVVELSVDCRLMPHTGRGRMGSGCSSGGSSHLSNLSMVSGVSSTGSRRSRQSSRSLDSDASLAADAEAVEADGDAWPSARRGERSRFMCRSSSRGGGRQRALRAEAEAARLRLEVATLRAEASALRAELSMAKGGSGGGNGDRDGGTSVNDGGGGNSSGGGRGGGGGRLWRAAHGTSRGVDGAGGPPPLPGGVTPERLLAELLDTKLILATAVGDRLALEWTVAQARRDDARLASTLALHASRLEVQLAGATCALHELRSGSGPESGLTPAVMDANEAFLTSSRHGPMGSTNGNGPRRPSTLERVYVSDGSSDDEP